MHKRIPLPDGEREEIAAHQSRNNNVSGCLSHSASPPFVEFRHHWNAVLSRDRADIRKMRDFILPGERREHQHKQHLLQNEEQEQNRKKASRTIRWPDQ